jgi:cytochrome c-type biogenesis protein CcmH
VALSPKEPTWTSRIQGRRRRRHGFRPGIVVLLAALAVSLVSPSVLAATGNPVATTARAAASPQPRTSYEEMVEQFRSVTCPDETLEQCTSSESAILKASIRRMVDEGWTKDQIMDAVVAEFGDRILAVSPRKGFTWWLWIMPAAGLAIGAVAVSQILKRKSREAGPGDGPPLPAGLDPYLDGVEREVKEDW